MAFKIKNWKLALLSLVFFCLFISLGCWQLSRAEQKKILLDSFAERTRKQPLSTLELIQTKDPRFYRARLEGRFDNEHTLLLDNKTFRGQIGYEVYTPFNAIGLNLPILVDRGFIPIGQTRKQLPAIASIQGSVTLSGMLNLPPTYVSWGKIHESTQINWPLRVQFINLPELSSLLGHPLYSQILNITPNDPAAYSVEWKVVIMGPEKHRAYAVQWFALALTLLILFVALNRRSL